MNSKIKKQTRVIFMGTPDFGIPSLRALIKNTRYDVIAIVSQSDKKIGRTQVLSSPPIKKEAIENNIKVFQPRKIIEIKNDIKKLNPDLIIVIAYGQIIPEEILNIPKYGSLNIHGSLLPKYRGAACVQAAILNGDKNSGITIMKMEAGLDTGPILYSEKIKIDKKETSETLYNKLSVLGSKNLISILDNYINGKINLKAQDNNKASYIKKINKIDGRIDWNKNAVEIERLIRAMTPWPGAYTKKNNKIIKIIKVSTDIKKINKYKPGDFFVENKILYIQSAKDAIQVINIQSEGKKILNYKDFIAGYSVLINS